MALYDVVRFFKNGRRRVVETAVTLEAAQAHCKDPETSSRTCKLAAGKARTRRSGEWFDGYRERK